MSLFNHSKVNAFKIYGIALGIGLSILLILSLIQLPLSKKIDQYYFSYRTSSGDVTIGEPLFDELNNILFPGYEINYLVRKNRLILREVNEFSHPALLLKDGTMLNIALPLSLIRELLTSHSPEVIILGSSRCREGFRPDIFVDEVYRETGRHVRALNLCVSGAFPELYLQFSEFLKKYLGKKADLIMLSVDEYSLNGSTKFKASAVTTLQSYQESLFKKSQALDLLEFSLPSMQSLFWAPVDSAVASRRLKFELPKDIDAKYAEFAKALPSRVDARLENFVIRKEGISSYRETIQNLESLSKKLVVFNSVTTDAFLEKAKNATSIATYKEETESLGVEFDLFSRQDLGINNSDYYYAKMSPKFDGDHMNPSAAITYTRALAAKYATWLKADAGK